MKYLSVSWFRPACHAAIAGMVMAASSAWGSTAMEEKVIRAPMPHTLLGGGANTIPVHYIRTLTGADSPKLLDNARKKAAHLKTIVTACVGMRRQMGLPANPPREFPQMTSGGHIDTYSTANREIVYFRNYVVQMMEDCSLRESEAVEAILTSYSGTCRIDVTLRAAEGLCDPAVHIAAPVPQRVVDNFSLKQQIALLKSKPHTAAAGAQLEQLVAGGHAGAPTAMPSTGATRQILGVKCEVINGAFGTVSCMLRGGTFRSYVDMLLEGTANGELIHKAVQAQVDAKVSSAVFFPHVAGGFRINPDGRP